jgi:FHA domain
MEVGMARIILSLNGEVLQELVLTKEATRIGRHPHNELMIENRNVSGEHALITLHGHDVLIEDLNSTNGTMVNGQPIKKHFLQDKDVLEIAKYKLQFLAEKPQPVKKVPVALPVGAVCIKILTGVNSGKQLAITKALTTIGRPGSQVAVIAQRADGYYLTHVEGEEMPTINGVNIGNEAQALQDGDVLVVAGTQMGFAWRKE